MSALVGVLASGVAALLLGGGRHRHPPRRLAPAHPRRGTARAGPLATVQAGLDLLAPARVTARRDGQLPDLLDRLAAARRAGSSLGTALAELGPASPAPLGRELQPLADGLRQGQPLDEALAGWGSGPSTSDDLELTTAALRLGARAGGEVARAIDRTAATLRERRSLQREVHALATQARASAAVLVAAPVAFTALVGTVEPGVIRFLLTTPVGLACVAAGIGLDTLGAAWMARIVRRAT